MKLSWDLLSSSKNLIGVILIALIIPVTVALVLLRQNFDQRAQFSQVITKVVFSPGAINTNVGSKQTNISAQALDQFGNPVTSGVQYSWGISSTNSIGRLTSVSGSIASFFPMNNGYGDIFLTAYNTASTVTSSIPVTVGNINITPTPSAQTFTVILNGSQEVPPITGTSGNGTATVTLNPSNNTLSYNINYSGLSSTETMAHIHGFAASGVGGAPILLTLPTANPKVGTWTYADTQEANILAGLTYFNIHTINNPNGEIRGQIVPPGGITPTLTPTMGFTKQGDVNGDNLINLTDLSMLLSNWNSTTFLNADFSRDGRVNLTDLSILLSNWGR